MVIDNNTILLLSLLTVWELIWKGFALWKASRNNQKNWFIIILCLNAAGILPMIYIQFFQKKKKHA